MRLFYFCQKQRFTHGHHGSCWILFQVLYYLARHMTGSLEQSSGRCKVFSADLIMIFILNIFIFEKLYRDSIHRVFFARRAQSRYNFFYYSIHPKYLYSKKLYRDSIHRVYLHGVLSPGTTFFIMVFILDTYIQKVVPGGI